MREHEKLYTPAGPVAVQFITDDNSPIKIIRGPVASGKTIACLFSLLRYGLHAPRNKVSDIRQSRFAIVATTVERLTSLQRQLRNIVPFTNPGQDSVHDRVAFRGHVMDFTYYLPEDIDNPKFITSAFTAAYFNCIHEVPDDAVNIVLSRVGRYPHPSDSIDVRPQTYAVGDVNDSWAELPHITSARVYDQPSAFSTEAENVANLPPYYYKKAVDGLPRDYILRHFQMAPPPREISFTPDGSMRIRTGFY